MKNYTSRCKKEGKRVVGWIKEKYMIQIHENIMKPIALYTKILNKTLTVGAGNMA